MSAPIEESQGKRLEAGDAHARESNGRLACPACGGALSARRDTDHTNGLETRVCTQCNGRFAVRARGNSFARNSNRLGNAVPAANHADLAPPEAAASVGGIGLGMRIGAFEMIRRTYPVVTCLVGGMQLALGGFVPVLHRWLKDEIKLGDGRAVVESMGGAWPGRGRVDPDNDLGPVLTRRDAPVLLDEVAELSRRLGAKPPAEIRLTYIPCCGVVAWGNRRRALLLGMPLLPVLTRGELRAVLAHELAHLARGDANRVECATAFVDGLARSLESAQRWNYGWSRFSPLRAWARWCLATARDLHAPIALGQEARADRAAATFAGGDAAASALVKVATVQPLFREVLAHYDPMRQDLPSLYAFFRRFWSGLSDSAHTNLRHGLLADRRGSPDPSHPPLLDRLAVVQSYPALMLNGSAQPATSVVGDLEAFERLMHERLYSTGCLEPSVFHQAGSR